MNAMKKPFSCLLAVFFLVHIAVAPIHAGGALESIDITGGVPSPVAGHIIARVIAIRWDAVCMPIQYSMNTSLNPIPNPLGAAFLSVAQAQATLQESLDAWNDVSTSYIDMQITKTTAKTTLRGFDMVNELTFRTAANFGAIASSPSVNLIADTMLLPGTDIDGDGDSDVSASIGVCADADGDGDTEFPPGFYRAGTILENDVQFNTKVSNGLRFTVADSAVDTVTRSVDLKAVAVHEFGHSHGLSHDQNDQISILDGSGSTMFPFIDTGDPASELSQRDLDIDDIAWSSYFYQEGSALSGPAALQAGDVAFGKAFGIIRGAARHGVLNQPIAGASVLAYLRGRGDGDDDEDDDEECRRRQPDKLVSSGFSGSTQLSFNPATGGLFFVNPQFNILDGNYSIPVPRGNYHVAIEPVDGSPVAASSISFTTQIGAFFGQQNFNEEFYNKRKEGALEKRPGRAKNVSVKPGEVESGIDITTNNTINVNFFGSRNFVGFTNVTPGAYYAVRIPAPVISGINPGQDVLFHSMNFDTFVTDSSTVPVFAEATLAKGTVDPITGAVSVDLAHPLERMREFVGQENDFAPFFFKNPHELGKQIRRAIARGDITNLFLVLRVPSTTPFPGVSAQAPFIGLDGVPGGTNDVAIFNLSYFSTDGVSFALDPRFNFRFSLVLSQPAQN